MGEFLDTDFKKPHRCKTPNTFRSKTPVWKCSCGQVWVYGDLRGFKGVLAMNTWYPLEQWEAQAGPVQYASHLPKEQLKDQIGLFLGIAMVIGALVFAFSNINYH